MPSCVLPVILTDSEMIQITIVRIICCIWRQVVLGLLLQGIAIKVKKLVMIALKTLSVLLYLLHVFAVGLG